jgi:thiamine-monophosphate kinase
VTAFGHVPEGRMIRRKGAQVGDVVFVTGTIGDSGGGLAMLKGEAQSEFRDRLVARYRIPDPPVRLGAKLRGLASAALDVSDGLLADLGHIADVSGVRIVVEAGAIPRSEAVLALWPDDIVRAATAGDDYQIALTAAVTHEAQIMAAARDLNAQVTRIGRVELGAGVALLDAEAREIAVARAGYRHF